MAKSAAIVISWGTPVRGREGKALEVFMESLGWWGKQAADGRCGEPIALFSEDGSNGMLIIRGMSDALRELEESDEGRIIQARAGHIVEDLKTHWYLADDEIAAETQRFVQAGTELGFM